MIIVKPDANWEAYKGRYLACIHQLLAWGYEAIKGKINATHQEEEITGWLAEAIQKRLDAPQTPPEYNRYSLSEEVPVHHSKRSGKNRQRIDIVITYSEKRPRPEFCCEAKRLKTQTNTIAKYLGAEGLECFLKCEYASDQNQGAMLGYLQNATPAHWHSELNKSLEKVAKAPDSHVLEPLTERVINQSMPHEWQSKHQRSNQKPIDIYHIFMDFTEVS